MQPVCLPPLCAERQTAPCSGDSIWRREAARCFSPRRRHLPLVDLPGRQGGGYRSSIARLVLRGRNPMRPSVVKSDAAVASPPRRSLGSLTSTAISPSVAPATVRRSNPERGRERVFNDSEILGEDACVAGLETGLELGDDLPNAAFALTGFLPEFAVSKSYSTLRDRLRAFGDGMEISLLSVVPKGSALALRRSSPPACSGALNRACTLGWDEIALSNRVLGVEPLTTLHHRRRWSDQAGPLFRRAKLILNSSGARPNPGRSFPSWASVRTALRQSNAAALLHRNHRAR